MSQFKVYNASAGSGKTFTLVKEYLKILLDTNDYFRFQNILAITFTNKAAAEMKDRVLDNLRLFSEKKSNDMLLKISDELSISPEIIFNKSAIILNNIIQNYAAFNIMTIDSFTYRIVRNFAFDLGLSLNFDVELDVDKVLSEAVDIVVSKIGIDKELTKTLINYSLQKVDNDKSWDITSDLKSFARILFNENDINNVKTIQDKKLEDFIKLKDKLFKEQKEVEKHLKEIGVNGVEVIESIGLEHNDFYRSMLPNHFVKLSENFEKASFFDQNKLRERIEENTFYANSKSSEVKNNIENVLSELLELYFYSEQLFQKHTLNKLVLNSIIPLAVLNYINQTLSDIKENNNIRLNAEFNKLIFDKIKDEPAPFIYERLGEKFRYYFIDEMQDTSVLQWENIIPLIDNALVSEFNGNQKGSLLLVGDAKQSIYRWRGGKAEQFIKLTTNDNSKSNNPFQTKKEVRNLETNYRSFSEIINFNNHFFNHVSNFFQNDSYKLLYNENNQQKENSKKGGFVQINFVDKKDEEEEKELIYPKKVLEIIQNLDAGFNRSDVCVLVRTNKQGIAVANYLSENEIKIVSSETLLLKNNSTIEFIINILSIVLHPNDKQFKISALYFLHDFLQIKKEKHLFFNDLIDLETKELFNHLKQYNINFNPTLFSKYSFYDGVEYLIRSFNLTKDVDAYLQFFLDFVLESHKKYGNSIVNFLEHWEIKKDKLSIIASEQEDAVKISTIHKAKGLEFPIVIFPFDLDI